MCGIVGYLGKDAKENIIKNLKKLEYRGYDSSGFAVFDGKNIQIVKNTGFVADLENISHDKHKNATVGIGHTRWATTGKVTKQNAHPHASQNKRFAIVHNGIIENYAEIKNKLESKGYEFSSQTDSEVIAMLLQENAKCAKSVTENIKLTTKMLKGAWSIAILDKNTPDTIFATKKEMPLFVGCGNNFLCLASAVVGLPENAKSYISLEDNDIATISLESTQVWNNDQLMNRKSIPYTPDQIFTKNHTFDHFMLKEIFEEEQALQNTFEYFTNIQNTKLQKIMKLFADHKRIHLIACGTAYHACLVGANILNKIGFDCSCHIASEFKYFPPCMGDDSLCIFVSQSGETADTIGSIKYVKSKNIPFISITNVESSSIAQISENIIFTKAGTEVAVASTKAYNCQCLIFYLLASQLFENKINFVINDLKISQILQNIPQLSQISKKVVDFKKIFFIGRGQDSLTASEGSLKLKEITYIPTESYPAGELKHGTLSLVDQNSLTIAIITQKSIIEKTMNAVHEIKARGGNVLVVTPFKFITQDTNIDMLYYLPALDDEILYPLISIIPLQLIAYFSSIHKGYNPDKPRNLAKSVTVE